MPGGQGGAPFEDSTTTKALRRIDIWYGDKVNAIVCSYDDNIKASRHGSDTGQWDFFALSEGMRHLRMDQTLQLDAY